MNQPQRSGPQEPQTTILHVHQFLPARPEACSEPIEGPTLIIKKAAEEIAGQSPQPLVAPKGSTLPPQHMLGAVAYAYAKGVYRSEDIERKMLQDPEFRQAVHNEVPSAATIRRFRRLNRAALLATLGKFFRWRRAQAAANPASAPAGGTDTSTQFFVKTEAEDLLNKAAWVDNMSKED